MTITLVFRDRHTDHYSFRSRSGERAFSSTNIILCSLSKIHSIFRLHSQDIQSMNGKSLLALAHNFLRIQEVYRLVLLFFSPMLQLMWPFQPIIRGVLILVRHEETIHRLAALCEKGFVPHNPCSVPNLDRQECNWKPANEFPTLRYEDCYCSSFKSLPHAVRLSELFQLHIITCWDDSVSDNTQRHATASNTGLRLRKVSVREIDITHGIPTDLPKTSSYNADQEVQLELVTKESEYTLLLKHFCHWILHRFHELRSFCHHRPLTVIRPWWFSSRI